MKITGKVEVMKVGDELKYQVGGKEIVGSGPLEKGRLVVVVGDEVDGKIRFAGAKDYLEGIVEAQDKNFAVNKIELVNVSDAERLQIAALIGKKVGLEGKLMGNQFSVDLVTAVK